MASVEAKDIPEIKRFMEDFWRMVKTFWIQEDTEEYWTAVIDAVDRLGRAYPQEFCRRVLFAFADYLDDECRRNEAVRADGGQA